MGFTLWAWFTGCGFLQKVKISVMFNTLSTPIGTFTPEPSREIITAKHRQTNTHTHEDNSTVTYKPNNTHTHTYTLLYSHNSHTHTATKIHSHTSILTDLLLVTTTLALADFLTCLTVTVLLAPPPAPPPTPPIFPECGRPACCNAIFFRGGGRPPATLSPPTGTE